MTLGELIERLEKVDPSYVVPAGFDNPHSYRGYYDQLAFEPKVNVTVGEMLADARSALGRTFTGYRGGEYKMMQWTPVWLSRYGEASDESIGPVLLDYMLGVIR